MNTQTKKERLFESCLLIQDAIIIGRITDYPKVNELESTQDYLMEIGKITINDLNEYQLKKLKNNRDENRK